MGEAGGYRSGFVALCGRPNVGKSSLVNRLVGAKVAIVSPKPQTTRRRIQGVMTRPGFQVVFLDTPGLQQSRDLLGRALVRAAKEALVGVDAAILVVDAGRGRGREDAAAVELLRGVETPVLLAVNKVDLVAAPAAEIAARVARELGFDGPALGVSALTGEGLSAMLDWISAQIGPGPQYFPDGVITDQPEEILVAEAIRERLLWLLEEEVPHEAAVVVEEMARRPRGKLYIRAVIVVERQTQRAIVLGSGGSRLKEIGQSARAEIERLLGEPVFLDLWVKVVGNWRDSPDRLREYGYENGCPT